MTHMEIDEWMNEEGSDSKSVLLSVSFTDPPSEKVLSEHAVVISYGEGVVVVDATRKGLRDLLRVQGVLRAAWPQIRRQYAMT
jgi:hypothetical protein